MLHRTNVDKMFSSKDALDLLRTFEKVIDEALNLQNLTWSQQLAAKDALEELLEGLRLSNEYKFTKILLLYLDETLTDIERMDSACSKIRSKFEVRIRLARAILKQ